MHLQRRTAMNRGKISKRTILMETRIEYEFSEAIGKYSGGFITEKIRKEG